MSKGNKHFFTAVTMDAKCEEVTKSVEAWSKPYDHFDIVNRVYEIKQTNFANVLISFIIFAISRILTQLLDPKFKSLQSDHLKLENLYIKKKNIAKDLSKIARYFVRASTLPGGN